MRLLLNNSGTRKLVLDDVPEDQLAGVKDACLTLQRASRGRMSWLLVVPSDVHPNGLIVASTSGSDGEPHTWRDRA